eukprot:GHVR01157148.1.p1 GENE.GHVR01157148.1~~GHVR01157148.1.p1  ORF type:complete len:362 (+),score=45.57 GHVR01157148.1:1240-2325(+)
MFMCMAIENAAKGHLEVSKSDIDNGTHDEAMSKELKQWLELGVLDPEDKPPLGVKPITTRWVHTWKLKDGERIAKAQGFKDHRDMNYIETYSGTADKDYIVSRVWDLAKTDVKTAFLQAPMEHKVWIKMPQLLPKDVPKGWKPDMAARACRAVYGLVDSPRIYTSFFKKKAQLLGWQPVAESILVKQDKTGKVSAILIMHVDDLLVASEDPVYLINSELKKVMNLDNAELLKPGDEFSYIGLSLSRTKEKLICDQSNYVKNIELSISHNEASKKLKEPHVSDPPDIEDVCLELEMQRVMGILGWSARTQPHLSYMFGELARWSTKPTQQKLLAANRGLLYAKQNSRALTFKSVQKPKHQIN